MTSPSTPQGPDHLARLLKDEAERHGFVACGITTAEPFAEAEEVMAARLEDGSLAGLSWFTRERAHLACTPSELLPGARSLVVFAAPYRTEDPPADDGSARGQVSRYAWGDDYHETLKVRLHTILEALTSVLGRTPGHRIFVDSSPLAEREAARRAGIGWFGKNTNILIPGIGSYVFLCALLLDIELPADEPLRKSCGSCDLCLRACPTGALPEPYVLDATRCISYLTIEHRGGFQEQERPLLGDHLFGCDICQEVCPVNRKGGPLGWPDFTPRPEVGTRPLLADLLTLSEEEYRRRFKRSPLKRAKLRGLQRNAAVVAGNSGDQRMVSPLAEALANTDPLVRRHAAWSLGQLGNSQARQVLSQAVAGEADSEVRAEIQAALERLERQDTP